MNACGLNYHLLCIWNPCCAYICYLIHICVPHFPIQPKRGAAPPASCNEHCNMSNCTAAMHIDCIWCLDASVDSYLSCWGSAGIYAGPAGKYATEIWPQLSRSCSAWHLLVQIQLLATVRMRCDASSSSLARAGHVGSLFACFGTFSTHGRCVRDRSGAHGPATCPTALLQCILTVFDA